MSERPSGASVRAGDFGERIRALDQRSELEARQLFADGFRFRLRDLLLRPPARFVVEYLVRGSFRRGVPGLVEPLIASYAEFVTRGKLWEREREASA